MTRISDASEIRLQAKEDFSRPMILCADDDSDITRWIEVIMSRYDVDVVAESCGQLAIWDAYGRSPDIIITDLRMSFGSGQDVLRDLKSNSRTASIPVIVLTGMRGAQLATQMKKLGAASFLKKPIDKEALLSEIERFVTLCEKE